MPLFKNLGFRVSMKIKNEWRNEWCYRLRHLLVTTAMGGYELTMHVASTFWFGVQKYFFSFNEESYLPLSSVPDSLNKRC